MTLWEISGHVYKLAFILTNNDEQDADDLHQDVFERLYRSVRRQGTLTIETNAIAYVYAVTRNCWRDNRRREKGRAGRESIRAIDDGPDPPDPAEGPESLAIRRVELEKLELAIGKLTDPSHREAVRLSLSQNSHAQAARRLGIPVSTYKSRLEAAARELRSIIRRGAGGSR